MPILNHNDLKKVEEVYQKVRGEYVYYESDLAIAKRLLSV